MSKRNLELENHEYYHIYNRGVDKRNIFLDYQDVQYFIDRIQDFNTVEVFGNAHNMHLKKNEIITRRACKNNLVEIIAYAVNPNHFHLILKQVYSTGISNFIQRLGTGYAKYFNKKYKRGGALFQGRFKAAQLHNTESLNKLSAYVNLNYRIHGLDPKKYIIKTSLIEYLGKNKENICWKKKVMKNFDSKEKYLSFCKQEVIKIVNKRKLITETEYEEKKFFEK